MNRTDRLYALVEKLRARAPLTMRAAELAKHFEVSTRTIERDLLACQEAGVPIWSQPGPGGGYGLDVEATLPPLNLTPAEAVALATALAATNTMPLAEAGQSALKKIIAVMASAPRDTASNLVSHIRVVQGSSSLANAIVDIIQHALLDGVAIELAYRDADGRETLRVIEPAGIFSTPNGWYLAAWCRLRQAPRAFRLDRIAKATVTQERVIPRSLDSLLAEIPYEFAQPVLK
jgi:predicted DNA-binding transcriptional regulator YafY